MESIPLGHPCKPSTSKLTYDDIKEAFLAKEWIPRSPPPQGLIFLKYECKMYLKQDHIETTTTQGHCCLPHLDPSINHCNWLMIN